MYFNTKGSLRKRLVGLVSRDSGCVAQSYQSRLVGLGWLNLFHLIRAVLNTFKITVVEETK